MVAGVAIFLFVRDVGAIKAVLAGVVGGLVMFGLMYLLNDNPAAETADRDAHESIR